MALDPGVFIRLDGHPWLTGGVATSTREVCDVSTPPIRPYFVENVGGPVGTRVARRTVPRIGAGAGIR